MQKVALRIHILHPRNLCFWTSTAEGFSKIRDMWKCCSIFDDFLGAFLRNGEESGASSRHRRDAEGRERRASSKD